MPEVTSLSNLFAGAYNSRSGFFMFLAQGNVFNVDFGSWQMTPSQQGEGIVFKFGS